MYTAGQFKGSTLSYNNNRRNSGASSQSGGSVSGPPPILVCRQAVVADAREALDLETAATRAMFGDVDLSDLIEKSICRSLFNTEKELVAFVSVIDHPNLPVLGRCSWQNWIRRQYRLEDASPWNTLFIHYLVWDVRYPKFFIQFLRSLYKSDVRLSQCLMVVPPGQPMFRELAPHFTPLYARGEGTGGVASDGIQTVHLNLRVRVIRKLIVRRAGEEDNIDVQPLVSCQYDTLKEVFGEFKLGNVIDLHDKQKSVLVAEKTSGVTVGVAVLTADVDYQHVSNFFFVPLSDFKSEMSKTDVSKQTLKHRTFSLQFTPAELQSINTGELDQLEGDEDSVEGETKDDGSARGPSLSSVLLDDDSQFRIVDPAMEYLMSLKRPMPKLFDTCTTQSLMSLASSTSMDSNTYYGRPSWSINMHTVTSQCVTKAQEVAKEQPRPYCGPERAFRIALFALHPDLDVRYAFDLLEAAFECYPEKHYCIMSLPTSYQGSPLTKYFIRLTPRLSRDFPHELYLVHRNSVFSEFKVRILSRVDLDVISELLENISQCKKIRKDLDDVLSGTSVGTSAYVMECEECIIGVAVVSEHFGIQQTMSHYRVEEVVEVRQYGWERHGMLRHVIVSPIFLQAAPYFLRQIMHQTSLDTLSYCLFPPDVMAKMDVTQVTVLGELCPVRPRRRIQYDAKALEDCPPEDFVVGQEQPFALFIASEKHLNVPKLELNYRVVVVGASDTAISFLENLIFSSAKRHIRYNNLTLVSIHGLPLDLRPHAAGDIMIPHSGLYTRDYLSRMSLHTHVNVLYGIVTVINRIEKMICLNDEYWMRYDYLFLFTGAQFGKPVPDTAAGAEADDCQKNEDLREVHNRISRECGDNLLLVNTSADAVIALGALKKIIATTKSGKILVFGNCLNVYTCIESLLTFGVPGQKIVLVESRDSCRLGGLDINTVIERAVVRSLEEAGVVVHHGYSLVNWSLLHKTIHRVMFRTDTHTPLTVDCLAFFCYASKVPSAKTYIALADSGIVYNNGIIIDNKFRTNDKSIFAAGPGTKYSSKYGTSQLDHEYFNSLEVGLQASRIFRQLVEPRPQHQESVAEEEAGDVLVLREPVTVVARLPGGWNYARISAPGRPMPLECQLHGQGESGPVLITGDPVEADGPGYFQLSLTVYGTVREIACLSKKDIPHHNLQCLYGKHERLLNSLLDRYNLGLISDLYAFFAQPWAYAIYTTDFDELMRQCAEIFQSDEEAGLPILQHLSEVNSLNGLFPRVHDWQQICEDEQERVAQMYATSSVPLYVEHLTLRYVSERRLQLPMYLTDADIATIHRIYTVSPLHRPRQKSAHTASY